MKPGRYELVEGTSSKFWEVSTTGPVLRVTFGRIGTAGQTKDKTLASPAAAEAEAAKLTREKIAKGYRAAKAKAQAPAKAKAGAGPKAGAVAKAKAGAGPKADAEAGAKANAGAGAGPKAKASAGALTALQAKIADLVPKLFAVEKQFAIQSGIEDDETFEEALGKPCKPADIDALETFLGKPLPPSYRAFLMVYGGWQGFAGGADLLGPEGHRSKHVKQTLLHKSALFREFEERDPISEGAIPLAIGDSRSCVLMEPSKKRGGEMDFVSYHLTEEEDRYPDLVALFEDQLKTTTSYLLKPAKSGKKLDGVLKKLTETASTANGRDLRIKWKGQSMEIIDLRSSRNGDAVAELVLLPAAKDVRELTLGATDDYKKAIATMAKTGWPASVTKLSIGHQRWGEMLPVPNQLGDIASALNRYAKVTNLDLTLGRTKVGKLSMPSVRRLTLRGLSAAQWAAFAAARWPNLETLTLRVVENRDLAAALATKCQMPKLRALRIFAWRDDQIPPLAKAWAKSPFAKQLRTLELVVDRGDAYLVKKLQEALGAGTKVQQGKDDEK